MMVGPMSPSPSEFAIGGASTRAISSPKSDCSIRVALRPPNSLGHETAAPPPSYNFRCHARRYGNDSSSGFSRHSPQSLGAFASSQVLSSSRNLVSSGVRFRSIQQSFQKAAATRAPKIRKLFRNFLPVRNRSLRPNRIAPLPIFLAQLFLQNLPSARLWKRLEKLNRPRRLIVRHAPAAKFEQLRLRSLLPRLQHHQRLRNFPPLLIRHRNHRKLVHGRMSQERLFYFKRRNILAAAHDNVLLPIHNQQVTFLINRRHVPSVKPSTAQSLATRIRIVPVALHHSVGARNNFTNRHPVVRHIHIIRIHHSNFHRRRCIARHRLPCVPVSSLPTQPRLHRRDRKH